MARRGMLGSLSDTGIKGPLVGGGTAWVGILATRYFAKDKSPTALKYAGLIGAAAGIGISGLLFWKKNRSLAQSGMITAALVGLTRQVESMIPTGTLGDIGDEGVNGYLGVITPEYEMQGANDVQLLTDGGDGLGLITAEQEMNGAGDVELLGAGFGSNFLASQ